MRLKSRSSLTALGLFTLLVCPASAAVVLNQVDTFTTGVDNWHVPGPSPSPPSQSPTNGPAGAGDAYLRLLAAGGSGPGSKLSVLNDEQWSGDYIAESINTIEMDVKNFGPTDVSLRLVFERFDTPDVPSDVALTNDVFLIPAGGDWQRISFSIDPANLIAVLGDITSALQNTTTLRLVHNPASTLMPPPTGPPPVAATLGVDNIAARAIVESPVPEPATFVLSALGLVSALLARRLSRHA